MQTSKKTLQLIFVWGMFLGIVCFLCVYGPRVLDVCNDGFIMKAKDQDLRQHYVGFMMYRNAPVGFPFGMIDTLSYPTPMSLVYTDSIPLFALLFRILSPVLPGTFQYFGWFALLSFALMGGFSARILYRITKHIAVSSVLPVLFVLSFPMLQRNFYHTSLTAQWIILLCIELWLSGICREKLGRSCAWWALVGFLCASIHIYFLPMALCILAGALLEDRIRRSESFMSLDGNGKCVDLIQGIAAPVTSLLGAAAVTLWAFGAFEGKASASYDVGIFGMNLNSFINSMGQSLLIPGLSTATDFQFEGAVYLGLGGMLLVLLTVGVLLRQQFEKGNGAADLLTALHPKRHPFRFSVLIACLVFLFAAVSPLFCVGSKILLQVPYPGPIGKIAGIFRSNGRFAWPVLYFVYLACAKGLSSLLNLVNKRFVPVWVCLVFVLIQLVDLSPMIREKQDQFMKYYKPYVTDWDAAGLPEGYKHFAVYEDNVTFLMELGYYAAKHDMSLSRFYFARNIDETIAGCEAETTRKLLNGEIAGDTVYVMDRDAYEDLKDTDLHFYASQKCVFGVKDPIPGREEVTAEDLNEIRWIKK